MPTTNEDPIYIQLLAERTELLAQLKELNAKLEAAKFGKRSGIRASIRNIEQQLRQNSHNINTYQRVDVRDDNRSGKNEIDAILAAQGIDARSSRFNAVGSSVSSGLSSVASAVGSIYGGQFGKFGTGVADQIAASKGTTTPTAENNKNLIYLGIGAVVLLLVIMMKKK